MLSWPLQSSEKHYVSDFFEICQNRWFCRICCASRDQEKGKKPSEFVNFCRDVMTSKYISIKSQNKGSWRKSILDKIPSSAHSHSGLRQHFCGNLVITQAKKEIRMQSRACWKRINVASIKKWWSLIFGILWGTGAKFKNLEIFSLKVP